MKITTKKEKGSKIILTVTLEEADQNKYENLAIKKLQSQVKIDGFRKGHVPIAVIRQKYGEGVILQESLDVAINQSYFEALQQEKLNPLSQPEIDIKEHSPLSYTAQIEVYPEVTVSDFDVSKVKPGKTTPTKKEIDEVVKNLKTQVAEQKEVEREAKEKDTVEIDFVGKNEKGEVQPGMESKNHPLEIGSNMFIPGFEEQLIGLKTGDEKTFDITFPDDYHAKDYAGKPFSFTVTVNKITEKILPKLTDDFVEKITGEKKSVDDLLEEIRGHLTDQKTREDFETRQHKIFELIGKATKCDIPSIFITEELDQQIDNIKMQGLQSGLPWEQYLQHLGKTEEELRKENEKAAKNTVTGRLGVQKLIEEKQIKVSDIEIQIEIDKELLKTPAKNKKKAEKKFKKGKEGWSQIENRLQIRTLFADLMKQAEESNS